MEKLDRLGWAVGLNIQAYGVCIGIRTNDPQALRRVEPHLPPGWTAGAPEAEPVVDCLLSLVVGGPNQGSGLRRFNLLYSAASRVSRTMDFDLLLRDLESYLDRYVAETARRRVFIHAGVVGWRGHAILIPGRSHSGKSTLVAALVRAGAVYHSDEYAILDGKGNVHPYPRPLQLRNEEGPRRRLTAEDLGGRVGEEPLPVGLVAVVPYQRGAQWRVRRISPGRAALRLLANSVPARFRPKATLRAIQPVAARARAFMGVRGEAEEAAEALLRLCDDAPRRRQRRDHSAK